MHNFIRLTPSEVENFYAANNIILSFFILLQVTVKVCTKMILCYFKWIPTMKKQIKRVYLIHDKTILPYSMHKKESD